MSYVVQCSMPNPDPNRSPTMQSARTFEEAKQQAKEWIKKFNGQADIYDTSAADPTKPVMTDHQIREEMKVEGDRPS